MAKLVLLAEEQEWWIRLAARSNLMNPAISYEQASQVYALLLQVSPNDEFAIDLKDYDREEDLPICVKCGMASVDVKTWHGRLRCPVHAPPDYKEQQLQDLRRTALKLLSIAEPAAMELPGPLADDAERVHEDMHYALAVLKEQGLLHRQSLSELLGDVPATLDDLAED